MDSVLNAINSSLEEINYNELSTEEKIRYDLFLAYSVNSLLWMYLRMNGIDPSETVIKAELKRVKDLMAEFQHSIDRKTIMPRIDQGAAKRFVKHGLWEPNQPDDKNNKHMRFE